MNAPPDHLMSAKNLLQRIERIAQRARRWAFLHAAASIIVATLGSFAILSTLDYLFGWRETGMRWLASILWLTLSVFALAYFGRQLLRFRLTAVQVSEQVERRFPSLKDNLSSAIAFASTSANDRRFGSPALRAHSIAQAETLIAKLPIEETLNSQPALRMGGIAGSILLVLGILSLVQPSSTFLASQRLLMPWLDLAWPQQHRLRFIGLPNIVAAGTSLEVLVTNEAGELPDEVILSLDSLQDASDIIETFPMKITREGAVLTLPPMHQPIALRATGGDDNSMPWIKVDVGTPTELQQYKFQIEPPAYSGLPPSEVVGQSIRVLADSRIKWIGELKQPVTAASVAQWKSAPIKSPPSSTDPASTPTTNAPSKDSVVQPTATLDRTKKNITLSLAQGESIPIQSNTEFSLTWTSGDGLSVVSPTWIIQAASDQPPLLQVKSPTADLNLTSKAAIEIDVEATDDLGLQSLSLVWQTSSIESSSTTTSTPPTTTLVPLWKHVLSPSALGKDNSDASLTGESYPRRANAKQFWSLPLDANIREGSSITIWLEAIDSKGQVGRSVPRRVVVQTPAETLEQLATRQADLLPRLEQALTTQEQASQPVSAGLEVLRQTGSLQQSDRDALQGAQRNQKATRKQLVDDASSIAADLEAIAEQLDGNGLSDSDLAIENKQLLQQLKSLDDQWLGKAQQQLQKANETIQREGDKTDIERELTEAEGTQREAIAALQEMTQSLSRSDFLRQTQSSLQSLARKQQDLIERTQSLQREQLTRPDDEKGTAERARLETAQSQLARSVEQIQQQLTEALPELRREAPSMASAAEQALEGLNEKSPNKLMRDAASAIRQDRLGDSTAMQQQAQQAIIDAMSRLSPKSNRTLQEMAEQLGAAAKQTNAVADAQKELAKNWQAEQPKGDQATRFAQQQEQLRRETEKLIDRMEAAFGESMTGGLNQAAADQATAESMMDAAQHDQATQAAQQAAENLTQAAEQLQQAQQQMKREATREQLQRLGPLVERLQREQTEIVAQGETLLDANIDPALRSNQSRQTASQQLAVRQLLQNSAGEISQLPAFDLVVESILQDMEQSVAGFEREQIANPALPAARAAARRLDQISQSLQPPKKPETNPQDPPAEDGQSAPQDPNQGVNLPSVASLRLLRSVQIDLMDETKQIQDSRENGALNAEGAARLQQISKLQRKLADQVDQLAEQVSQQKQ